MSDAQIRRHLRFLIIITLINAPLQWALSYAFTH
jgi:hypothetical protein